MNKIIDVRSQSDSADEEVRMSAWHLIEIERTDVKLRNDFKRIIGETPIDQAVGIACFAAQKRVKSGDQQNGAKAAPSKE